MPDFLAVEIVAIKAGGSEERDDAGAIRRGRRSRGWVCFVREFGRRPGGTGLPKDFSIVAIEGENDALVFGRSSLRHENAIFPDNWSRVAAVGQGNTPFDVLVRGPMRGEIFLIGKA